MHDQQIAEIQQRVFEAIEQGTVTYELAADLMQSTVTGQSIGVSREVFIAKLQQTFPTQELLSQRMRTFLAMFEKMTQGGALQ